MKKLRIISEKIECSNNNYFGRGSFETVIKNNKEVVLSWFEDLLSIQSQIRILNDEYACENLQKRNYVRIITKLFPKEYNQFVCINILLRDIDSITLAFSKDTNTKVQYKVLVANNRLKFPGKHKKYVDFDTYQQFITLYSNDLIEKSQDFETKEKLSFDILENKENKKSTLVNDANIVELEDDKETLSEVKTVVISTKNNKTDNKSKEELEKTNWMNVLLKGI